jgi:flagellar motor switch protein FliN/FliY
MSELDVGEEDWSAALSEQAEAEAIASEEVQTEFTAPPVFKDLSNENSQSGSYPNIDFILDIPVQLTVELGRTKIAIKNLLQLTQGSVVELDGLAGEPMDVLVNGCLIAHGEVVVVNDKFGIRLTDITSPTERIQRLNR